MRAGHRAVNPVLCLAGVESGTTLWLVPSIAQGVPCVNNAEDTNEQKETGLQLAGDGQSLKGVLARFASRAARRQYRYARWWKVFVRWLGAAD